MSSEIIVAALALGGTFTLTLGIVHLAIPLLMDFDHAIPAADGTSAPLRSIGFGRVRYHVLRSDVRGIAWVMSNAASYVLITLGIADLASAAWLSTDHGRLLAVWAAGWWAIRAGCQLLLGRRIGDWLVAAWFAGLAGIHAAAALV